MRNTASPARGAGSSRILAVLLAVGLSAGCSSGSRGGSDPGNNNTGPRLVDVQYVDVDGNGVDSGDLLVLTFEDPVFITSSLTTSYEFVDVADTLGSNPRQTQSVPGSLRVEIVLGSSASFLVGTSVLDVRNSGTISVEGSDGADVRPGLLQTRIDDLTATAPTLLATHYQDDDGDGTIGIGDTVHCEFDKPVSVAGGVAASFMLPVAGDSFGMTPGLSAFTSDVTNRGALITLGDMPSLTVSGVFDLAVVGAGSPSAIQTTMMPTITDTTMAANMAVGMVAIDLVDATSNRFFLQQAGSLFLGNDDSTAANVRAQGFFEPRGVFHFSGMITVSSNTFAVDLFCVADTQNNRVLIYDGKPTANGTHATAVLGQNNFNANLPNRSSADNPSPAASTLWAPTDVQFVGAENKLIVSDTSNHRVLVWENFYDDSGDFAFGDGADASVVLGQASFTSRIPNQGLAGPDATTLHTPGGIAFSGGSLAVADTGNHRVMIWSGVPTMNTATASTVLGQVGFAGGAANGGGMTGAAVFDTPLDVVVNSTLSIEGSTGAVLVADAGNNRVSIFESGTPATGAPADRIIGQADALGNAPGTTATTLQTPVGVTATATHVFVSDHDNHRVMVYAVASLTADGAAGVAIGQIDAMTGTQNRTLMPDDDTFLFPRGVTVSESAFPEFFVADGANHRVLNWTTVPTVDGSADLVQGHAIFTTSQAQDHLAHHATSVALNGGSLLVADRLNNRVMIYNTVPTAGNPDPDVVVGQGTLFGTLPNAGGGAGLDTLHAPEGVATDGTRMVVADTGNNRVLIYGSIPTVNGDVATVVLGQSTSSGTFPNAGGISAATMDSPTAVALDGTQLIVSDRDNHRVLIFSDVTTLVTGSAADIVLGQDDFTSSQPNQGGQANRNTLNLPQGLLVQGLFLYVADSGNHRVLGFPFPAPGNGTNAEFVLGQSSFTSVLPGTGTTRFKEPSSIASDGTGMMIADSGNHRVVVYHSVVAQTGAAADSILGQGSFSSGLANRGASTPSAQSLWFPRGVVFNGLDLFVADQKNSRVVRFR